MAELLPTGEVIVRPGERVTVTIDGRETTFDNQTSETLHYNRQFAA